jgi:hypothetical protein
MKQEKNERVEIYYEKLLKLVNSLQHKIIDRIGLQPYLHVATAGMKREIMQQHKESTLVYEEGISEI